MAKYLETLREVTTTFYDSSGVVVHTSYQVTGQVTDEDDDQFSYSYSLDAPNINAGRTRDAQRDAMVTKVKTERSIP